MAFDYTLQRHRSYSIDVKPPSVDGMSPDKWLLLTLKNLHQTVDRTP
jgi:hypothetical protein